MNRKDAGIGDAAASALVSEIRRQLDAGGPPQHPDKFSLSAPIWDWEVKDAKGVRLESGAWMGNKSEANKLAKAAERSAAFKAIHLPLEVVITQRNITEIDLTLRS